VARVCPNPESNTRPLVPAAGSDSTDPTIENSLIKANEAKGAGTPHHLNTDQRGARQREAHDLTARGINTTSTTIEPCPRYLDNSMARPAYDSAGQSIMELSPAASHCVPHVEAVLAETDEIEIDGIGGGWHEVDHIPDNGSSPSRERTPVLHPTHSYPTPQSNPPGTPTLANEKIKRSAVITSSNTACLEFLSPCPSKLHCIDDHSFSPMSDEHSSDPPTVASPTHGVTHPTSGCMKPVPAGRAGSFSQAPLDRSHKMFGPKFENSGRGTERVHEPMSASALEDDFGDKEIESTIVHMHEFLQDTSDMPGDSRASPTETSGAGTSPEDTTLDDDLIDAEESGPASCSSPSSSTSHQTDNVRERYRYINSRKRKHTTEDDEVTVEEGRHSLGSLFDDSTRKSPSCAPSPANNEDLDAQSHLPLSSPSPESPLCEDADDTETREPRPWDAIFSTLTPKESIQVQSTGNRLLMSDFATFLDRHSRDWVAHGFWDAPSWKMNQTSGMKSAPNRAGLLDYLVDLQNEDETQYLKLLVSRVLLFLLYEREIQCESKRGTAVTALKRNATNNLCNASELSAPEKRKLKKSLHNNKRLGEYWWWCANFFGPSFLLRCSKETASKKCQYPFLCYHPFAG
jgi:hypothetical protein